ncbi:MAG TPA: DUF4105 domain-containing protein [Beijerinckiaceae bacterium]|nr:DUF4105 domain-containing protein [Beijerinckiaceae bacterium]
MRLPGYAVRGALAVGLLAFAGWAELAILFHAPLSNESRILVATLVAAVLLIGSLSVLARVWRRLILPVVLVVAIGMLAWWSSIKPSDTRDWMPDVAKKAVVTIRGDDVEIRNVRNFTWTGPDTAQEQWQDRIYSLSDVTGLDLFLSTWGNPRIAHAITSFSFSNGPPVAFSFEIRKRKGQDYSAIGGFFKQYELVLIAADEADVVKVRTNRRNETVHRYRIDVKPENATKLLREYARISQELSAEPRWYHTIWTSCSTTIYWMLRRISPDDFPFDLRVLLSGYLPGYLYDIGFLDRKQPLDEIMRRADITALAKQAEGQADFSAAIRK